MKRIGYVLVLLMLFVFLTAVSADVKLPSIIGSNMVLQQDAEVPIWGKANPGERVTVSFNGQKVSAKSCSKGYWMV